MTENQDTRQPTYGHPIERTYQGAVLVGVRATSRGNAWLAVEAWIRAGGIHPAFVAAPTILVSNSPDPETGR